MATPQKKTPAKANPAAKAKPVKKEAKHPKKQDTKSHRETKSPYKEVASRRSRSDKNLAPMMSLGPNGKDVVVGSGSVVQDLADQVKKTPKYQRLSHKGREGKAGTEEQPEAQLTRKKLKAKVAVQKRRVETEEEFLEAEFECSQAI